MVVNCFFGKLCFAVQTAVKQELKKANAAAAVTQMSVAGMGGEEQGAAARASPDTDGTGTAARKSEKVSDALVSLLCTMTILQIKTGVRYWSYWRKGEGEGG